VIPLAPYDKGSGAGVGARADVARAAHRRPAGAGRPSAQPDQYAVPEYDMTNRVIQLTR